MKKIILFVVALVMMVSAKTAFAVPLLQLYIEGASYNTATQSWLIGSNDFILWVLGNVETKGTIEDVHLVAAYKTDEKGYINIFPTKASDGLPLPGGDPSSSPGESTLPLPIDESGINTIPLMVDLSPLPKHGEYGEGVSWNTYELGDFTLMDSPIGDYINGIPSTFPNRGQINAYHVIIENIEENEDEYGYSEIHFDAFDHIAAKNNCKYKSKFAPFSHDADWTPEPSTLTLLGMGLLGMLGFKRKKS